MLTDFGGFQKAGMGMKDVVYVVVLKRTDGTQPKVEKIVDEKFYMVPEKAFQRFMEIDPEIRNSFEVRSLLVEWEEP